MFSTLLRGSLLWALGHRRGQTSQSAALELGSSWKQRLLDNLALSCLTKHEEVQEPVGGGAVDVYQLADAAFIFSCLLPELMAQVKSEQVQLLGTNCFQ